MDGSTLAMMNSRPPSHHQQQSEYLHHHHNINDDRFEAQNPNSPPSDLRRVPVQQPSAYKPSPVYEQPLQRVAVDWPTERDEEEYRFVSSRIAGVEDSQDPVIHEDDLFRGRDARLAPPPPAPVHQDVRAPVNLLYDRDNQISVSVHDSNVRRDSAHQEVNQRGNFVPQELTDRQDDTLRAEIFYQEEMRRRLKKQQEEISQLSSVVPPLDLTRTSTPREEGVRDSLDISLRSESEDEEEAPGFAGLAVAHPSSQQYPATNNSSQGQRLSAQHRAEMTQVLSSLGGGNPSAGPELAIDKDLYESSRRSRQGHHEEASFAALQEQPQPDPETEENLEFLRKIHDYNEALRAKVQEDAWNSHAASAASERKTAVAARDKNKRGRKPPPSGQRMAGQSAPPDVGRTFISQASSQQRLRSQEPMEDFVRRNKSIPEQMQRVRSKSYSERYRERHSPSSSERRTKPLSVPQRGGKRVNQNVPPANLSAPPPISEEDEVESSLYTGATYTGAPIRAPLGPIQLAPGMTVDLNLHIHPHGAIVGDAVSRPPQNPTSPYRIPPRVQYEMEREKEWAFVHDPEHSYQPPSPRSQMLQKFGKTAQPRLHYDSDLLDHQAHMAAGFSKQSPLPPISRYPESSPDALHNKPKEKPFMLRNPSVKEAPSPGSYLDVFKQSQSGVVAHAQYREYTLREYKNLRGIASLGGLGPDFDNDGFKSQRDRNVRRKKYAEQVNSRNLQDISKSNKKAPAPTEQQMHERFIAMSNSKPSKRQLMMEYTKGLEQRHIQLADEAKRRQELEVVRPTTDKLQKKIFDTSDLDDILNDTEFERLKRRHEQDRAAQESIRQQALSSRSQVAASNR